MWFSAPFEEHLERAYQTDLLAEKIRLSRMVCYLAIIFNFGFYLLDQYTLSSSLGQVQMLRATMFATPLFLLFATYQPWFNQCYTVLMCCGMGILGLCINAIIALAGAEDLASNTYYAGLMLVTVALHMLTFLPVAATGFVTGTLIISYVAIVIGKPSFASGSDQIVLITNLFFVISTAIISLVGQLLRDRYTRDNYVLRSSLQRDVTVNEEKRRLASYLAEHDVLTGLPNRFRFDRLAELACERASATDGYVLILFIDLDNFKPVNDTHGHAAGDRVLTKVAERISRSIGHQDVAARFGGDEFVICVEISKERVEEVGLIAAKVSSAVERAIEVRGHQLHLSASVGAAAYPLDGDELSTVIEVADAQMYRSKQLKGEITLSPGLAERLRRSNGESVARSFDVSATTQIAPTG